MPSSFNNIKCLETHANKKDWWNPHRNGYEQDGLLVDLKWEKEERERRVDESQDEVLFRRLEEEKQVGGKWGERSGSQAGHGQRLDVVELLDFDDNVDGAPNIGNLKNVSLRVDQIW